jgi:signal transduction histidine kinase
MSYAGLVALVLGGLASVTAAALSVEAAQRQATLASEVAGKERLALWRLDGQLFPAIALENSRPYAHYSTLHAAFPALDPSGPPHLGNGIRLPSPLLATDLPDWMLLHFQLDADAGWTSPQVLPNELAETLRNSVGLANVTAERGQLLTDLRAGLPVAETVARLAVRNPATGFEGAFVVPVPDAAEPSSSKPLDAVADLLAASESRTGIAPADAGRENPLRPRVAPEAVAGVGRSNATVVPPDAGNPANTPGNNFILGNRTSPQSPAPPATQQTVPIPSSNSDEYNARVRASKQLLERPGSAPGAVNPGAGFGGGQGGFGGGGFGGGQFGQVGNGLGNSQGGAGMGFANSSTLDSAVARNGVVALSEDVIAAGRAVRKGSPTLPPVAVHVGPMRAEWLAGTDGRERLVLVRAAHLEAKTAYQGVLLDWPRVQTVLREQVADLFPNAALTPVLAAESLTPERAMTALPAQLDPGDAPDPTPLGVTPLRLALMISWATVLLAVAAVGFGGHALLDLSERRIRFVAAVTHELRTPLTTLRLYLDLLTSGLLDGDEAKRQEYLQTLSGESERLHRLVENVLDFARLENRRVQTPLHSVPVNDLLSAVQQTWAERCAGDGKTLLVHSLVPPGQYVRVDVGMAEQVLGNLIDNARKYSRDAADGRVWLWARPDERGRVAFEVEDRGPGVPAAERSGVFEPFRRGDRADAAAVGGAGLGLALARHWAEQLRGRLTYRPADGGTGACFRLTVEGVAGDGPPDGPRLQ